jgi:6,7-dimethyl-8-ribityllumazine synthase
VRTYEGDYEARGRRFAIVASRFNEIVVAKLVEGATACLRKHGIAEGDLELAWTPGAFEIPLVARRLANSGCYDAVICLGAVIRGDTPHFDYVSSEAARGIAEAGRRSRVPVIFGVLTTDTFEQAQQRAGGKHGNKGWDAAMAAIEMASLLDVLPKEEST